MPFKEASCFKFFDSLGLETYENAARNCQENGGNLVTIRSQEEQLFLVNLLFTRTQLVDNFWLGGRYNSSSGEYSWSDENAPLYSNWAPGYPKKHTDYCVAMDADEELRGKWIDESCKKRYAVVCQKRQFWTLEKVTEIVMKLQETPPIPLGFVYVQLPKEKAPGEVWPLVAWKDVSKEYAGVFFRAVGGEAADFGKIQEANSNRLEAVKNLPTEENKFGQEKVIVPGNWSAPIYTGFNSSSSSSAGALSFSLSPGEVRPRNVAVRIWKRIA